MFSENGKISGRQAFRLLTFDLLGYGTLVIPSALAEIAGRDGIFCIGIGVGAALFFLKLMACAVQETAGCSLEGNVGETNVNHAAGVMCGSYAEYLEHMFGQFCGKLVQTGYLIYFLLLAGYTAYLFCAIVIQNLLRDESYYLVLFVILILAWYGQGSGLEGRARVYELLFPLVLLPLFFMLASAVDEVETDYWMPVFGEKISGIPAGSYAVFIACSVMIVALFAGEHMRRKQSLFPAARAALLFSGSIYAVLYLILLGIFGADALAQMKYPAVTLMSMVKISGGFLKRADAFMFGIWFFTLYALLGSAVFYGETLLRRLFFTPENKTYVRYNENKMVRDPNRYSIAVMLLLVFGIAALFYRSGQVCEDYQMFLWYVGTPFVVLIPLLLTVFRWRGARRRGGKKKACNSKWKKKTGLAGLFFVMITGVCGCMPAELEERNFPMETAVKNTDQFAAEWLNAGQSGNRVIDYSHMKVLVLDRAFLENASGMEEFLDLLSEKSDMPRNTYLVTAEDAEAILNPEQEKSGSTAKKTEPDGSGGGAMEESAGTYIEQWIEHVSEVKKTAYPTLGMFYREKYNQQETVFVPYVEIQSGKPTVTQYFVWKRGKAAGIVDSKTALLSFFTQNQTAQYDISLDNGSLVRLTGAKNQVAFEETDGRRKIVVTVVCSGEEMYHNPGTDVSQEELEHLVECEMNRTAEQARRDRGVDVVNSFKKLGGYQRAWYAEYRENEAAYEEELCVEYRVNITWVNL